MLIISGYLIRRQSESYSVNWKPGKTIAQMAINAESGVLFESTGELDNILTVLAQFDDVRLPQFSITTAQSNRRSAPARRSSSFD